MPETPQQITAEANNALFDQIVKSSYTLNDAAIRSTIANGADVNARNSDGNGIVAQIVILRKSSPSSKIGV